MRNEKGGQLRKEKGRQQRNGIGQTLACGRYITALAAPLRFPLKGISASLKLIPAKLSPQRSPPINEMRPAARVGAPRRHVTWCLSWAHFSKDALSFSSLGHGHIACGHCCSMSTIINEIIRVYRSIT